MKKIFALLLLVSVITCFLSGCDMLGYYKIDVTGAEDSLMQPLKPYYRAGEKIEIRSYIATDVGLYVFVNGEEIPMSYYGKNYWAFEFVMPEKDTTIHLTRDRFYGRDEFDFDELKYFSDYIKDDLFKVSVKKTNAAEKYSFIETRYSSRMEDIESFKSIFDQKLIKVDKDTVSATVYKEYSLFHDSIEHGEGTHTINFRDEFYMWNDFSSSKAFKFADPDYVLPTIEDPDLVTYSFRYDGLGNNVKKYGDENFTLRYTEIGAVEFVPYGGEAIDIEPEFYLDSGYGKINLLTPVVFELNGQYYEIVSGDDYWAYNYLGLEKLS